VHPENIARGGGRENEHSEQRLPRMFAHACPILEFRFLFRIYLRFHIARPLRHQRVTASFHADIVSLSTNRKSCASKNPLKRPMCHMIESKTYIVAAFRFPSSVRMDESRTYTKRRRLWVRMHEKGGKAHAMAWPNLRTASVCR
jgi:hypothetical protein